MACQLLEIEVRLKKEYEEFIETREGKIWKESWKMRYGNEFGDFTDYLYDFYPEMLQ